MGAFGVSLAPDNQYSQDIKDLAVGTSIVCGLGVVFGESFGQEVFTVADQLMQADSRAKNLQLRIKSLQSQLNLEKSASVKEQADANKLDTEIQSLQSQLTKL